VSARRLVLAAAASLWAGAVNAQFVTAPVTTAHVGLPYTYEVQATGSGRVVITAPNGLPSWLTLLTTGPGRATLSGTPSAGDSGSGIVLRSEDTTCRIFLILCYQYQFFDITIVQNEPPRVVPPGIADQSAVEGEPFSLDVSGAFTDPDGDPLTYSAEGLPSGFVLSGSEIAGTPTMGHVQGSPYAVRVTADDGRGGRVSEEFRLSVGALDRADLAVEAVEITPSPARSGEMVEWRFHVANLGPNQSGSAELAVVLRGTAVALAAHACTEEAIDAGQRLICPLQPIASGGQETVAVSGTAEPGDVYVTAEVRALGDRPIDPTAANNRAVGSLNVGESISAEPAQLIGGPAFAAASGDVDGDGYDDLLAATEPAAPAALHLNLENPSSLHPTLAGSGDMRRGLSTLPISLGDEAANTGAAFADFDGDGELDAVVVSGPGRPEIFINDGSGALSSATVLGSADTVSHAVAVADFNGDGFPDIVVANAGRSVVYMNRSAMQFDAVELPRPSRKSVGVAVLDVNGDGLPDVVLANDDGDATLHINSGSGFGSAALATGPTAGVAAGDFDGDGRPDLVFARTAPGAAGVPSNIVYLNDGAGGFAPGATLGASPTVGVLVADLDEDGRLDIVAINATGAHQVYLGDGAGNFSLHPHLFVSRGATGGTAARIGKRQSTDIVIVGEEGAAVFFNDGSGRLGLGDTSRPVIELIGAAEIAVVIDQAYDDPGATAKDDVDGELSLRVDNPVDTKVIGTYTVTYTAVDSAGNAAVPVTRTVRVQAREARGGGGGGAADTALMLLLGVMLALGRGGAMLQRRR
jgi:hypothetical protein